MRASELGIARAGRALAYLLALAALLWVIGYAAAANSNTFDLYRRAFGRTMAHEYVGRLAEARDIPDPRCLIVGPSTAVRGFDEDWLNAQASGIHFINAGTPGGAVYAYDIKARLLERSGVRPTTIVVAVHPFLLVREADLKADAAGYVSFFDCFDGGALLAHEPDEQERANIARELRWNTVWPPHRHARQIGRFMRGGLAELHRKCYWGPKLRSTDFARMPGEFNDAGRLPPMKQQTREQMDADVADFVAQSLPQLADTSDEEAALIDALRRLESLCDRMFVIQMPEVEALRAASEPVKPKLLAVLAPFESDRVTLLDYSELLTDDQFYDVTHARPEGRAVLSERLQADVLKKSGSPE